MSNSGYLHQTLRLHLVFDASVFSQYKSMSITLELLIKSLVVYLFGSSNLIGDNRIVPSRVKINSTKLIFPWTRVFSCLLEISFGTSIEMISIKWLEHLCDQDNQFKTGVVRANEG